ncbi:hypothetical protein HBJ16_004867 [Pseudomonas sp. CES]|uniref:Uncharacterized protein n=1 Tax=Pseudomonas taiwanensis SJ9 TaxID=1388762 RepID=V7DC64_9PSED|nr:hypothetical protein O164_14225 [Pseudomonas taiwanensis SJ9]KAF4557588.1 hypothetical protein HBJ16_004867 [Pseudomonas sp. CES]
MAPLWICVAFVAASEIIDYALLAGKHEQFTEMGEQMNLNEDSLSLTRTLHTRSQSLKGMLCQEA